MDNEERVRIYQENLNTEINCRMSIKTAEEVIKEPEKLRNTLGIEVFETEYPQLLVMIDWLQLILDRFKHDVARIDTFKNQFERLKKIHEMV